MIITNSEGVKFRQHAIVSVPVAKCYTVIFRYIDRDGATNHHMPIIDVPCNSYAQARDVADAFNLNLDADTLE